MRTGILLSATAFAALTLPFTASGYFGPPTTIPLEGGGVEPRSIAVGDLNGDGKPDVVTAAYRSSGVTVFLGDGTGGLRLTATYPVGAGPTEAVLGDLNLDGKLDVVTVNYDGKNLSVLLGDGSGGFAPAPYSPIALGGLPAGLRLTDLNHDGRPDLVVTVSSPVQLRTFLGGASGFTTGQTLSIPSQPTGLAVADFNGDGSSDVAVGHYAGAAIYLGSSSGSLSPHAAGNISTGSYAYGTAAGDVNGDGRVDLVIGGGGAGAGVYLGSGTGTFSRASAPLPSSVSRFALGDVNGDGRLDLVVASDYGTSCEIHLGNGNGGFAPTTRTLPVPQYVTALSITDLNGDGKPEILATSGDPYDALGSLSIFLGDDFKPAAGSPILTSVKPMTGAVGDLNRDGRPDIVTLNAGNAVSVVLSGPANSFTRASGSPFPIPSESYVGLDLVDVDGDRNLDIALRGNGTLFFLMGDGSGGFTRAAGTPPSPGSDLSRFGDVNGDGKIDFVTRYSNSLTAKIYLGRGDGSFLAPISVTLGSSSSGLFLSDLAIGDVNGDGVVDLVVRRDSPNELAVFLGDARGAFREASSLKVPGPISYSSYPLRLADIGRDGRPEVVVALGNRVQTFFVDTAGKLTAGPSLAVVDSNGYATPAVLDMDGDGLADLATSYHNDVLIHLGDGSGVFQKSAGSPFHLGTPTLLFKDMNADGLPDAVAINSTAGSITIHFQIRLSVSPASLVSGIAGVPYNETLSGAGGTPPYLFKKTSGTLPIGLSFTSAGTLIGVPLARGTYTFSVTATDSKGIFGLRSYTMTVSAALPTSLVTLTSTPNPSAANQAVTLTAVVSGIVGTATGSVLFQDGPTALGVARVSGGSAVLSPSLVAGTHALFASYVGDASYRSAISAPVVQIVNGATVNPTLTLSTSANPVTAGQSVVLTARIAAPSGSPGGAISVFRNGSFLGTTTPDASGTARLTVPFPTSGTHTILATYAGDATFSPATSLPLAQNVKTKGGCDAGGDDALCTLGGRFLARVDWKNPYDGGSTGVGTAQGLTDNSGTFWFFSNTNLELVVKVLDGRAANGAFWVGFGALSDVEYTITIVDAETGNQKTYYNPPKHLGSFLDVNAFPISGSGATSTISETVALTDLPGAAATLFGDEIWPLPRSPGEADELDVPAGRQALAGCSNGPEALCLSGSQFLVTVAWKDPYGGSSGTGKAVPLTSDTGTFWFFDSGNVELMVKVLNGLAVNGRYWVLYGALSDVEYTITVTDTFTGKVKTYHNDPKTLGSGIDTTAF